MQKLRDGDIGRDGDLRRGRSVNSHFTDDPGVMSSRGREGKKLRLVRS